MLTVGDAEFQQRCLGEMSDAGREGRTVVYVSHELESLLVQICSRAIWLDRGVVRADGAAEAVVRKYLEGGFIASTGSIAHPSNDTLSV